MTTPINSVAALKQQNRALTELPPQTYMALSVASYDKEKNRVVGTNLETGEEVTVFLRPMTDAYTASLKKSRPEVAQVEKNVKVGGILRADRVYFDKKAGVYSAAWLTSLKASADFKGKGDETYHVLPAALARTAVRPVKGEENKFTGVLEVAFAERAMKIDSVASLEKMLEKGFQTFLDSKTRGSIAIRVFDGTDVEAFEARPKLLPATKEINYSHPAPAAESTKAFLEGPLGKSLCEFIAANPKFTVEVLRVEQIPIVGDTATSLNDKPAMRSQLQKVYSMSENETGFTPSVVCYAQRTDGSRYYLSAVPTSAKPLLKALSRIETANITPPNAAAAAAAAAAVAAAAATKPEVAIGAVDSNEFDVPDDMAFDVPAG